MLLPQRARLKVCEFQNRLWWLRQFPTIDKYVHTCTHTHTREELWLVISMKQKWVPNQDWKCPKKVTGLAQIGWHGWTWRRYHLTWTFLAHGLNWKTRNWHCTPLARKQPSSTTTASYMYHPVWVSVTHTYGKEPYHTVRYCRYSGTPCVRWRQQ